jgi:hypothetical protein
MIDKDEKFSDVEIVRRREAALKRMLSTPPTRHDAQKKPQTKVTTRPPKAPKAPKEA